MLKVKRNSPSIMLRSMTVICLILITYFTEIGFSQENKKTTNNVHPYVQSRCLADSEFSLDGIYYAMEEEKVRKIKGMQDAKIVREKNGPDTYSKYRGWRVEYKDGKVYKLFTRDIRVKTPSGIHPGMPLLTALQILKTKNYIIFDEDISFKNCGTKWNASLNLNINAKGIIESISIDEYYHCIPKFELSIGGINGDSKFKDVIKKLGQLQKEQIEIFDDGKILNYKNIRISFGMDNEVSTVSTKSDKYTTYSGMRIGMTKQEVFNRIGYTDCPKYIEENYCQLDCCEETSSALELKFDKKGILIFMEWGISVP